MAAAMAAAMSMANGYVHCHGQVLCHGVAMAMAMAMTILMAMAVLLIMCLLCSSKQSRLCSLFVPVPVGISALVFIARLSSATLLDLPRETMPKAPLSLLAQALVDSHFCPRCNEVLAADDSEHICEYLNDPAPNCRPIDPSALCSRRRMRSLEGMPRPGWEVMGSLPEDYCAAKDDPYLFFQMVTKGIARYLLERASFEFSYEISLTMLNPSP